MRRYTMHVSKPCCVTVLCLVGLSSLLAWYTYWAGWGGEGGSAHWERYLEGDLEAFARKETIEQAQYQGESLNLDSDHFNYQNFMKRRKETFSDLEATKTRKGEIKKYTSIKVVGKDSCVPFITKKNNTRICVHSKLFDPFISSHIRDTGSWEPDLLAAMTTTLSMNPDMHLLDIGCHVGTFTLTAALMGRRVVAVDPIRSNLFMLHSSLIYAGVRDSVSLLLNAVSDYAEPVRVIIDENNLGGSRVKPVTGHVAESDIVVDSVTMDDLIPVVNFKKVFIKIDVEGYEPNAFRRASRFFEAFDVRYILMEWMFQRHSSHGQEVIDFLTGHGFRPFADSRRKSPLTLKDYFLWPDNVIWYKRSNRRGRVKAKLNVNRLP